MALEPATRVRTKSRRLLLAYTPSCVCFCMGFCGATKQDAECRATAATSRIRSELERVMMVVIDLCHDEHVLRRDEDLLRKRYAAVPAQK